MIRDLRMVAREHNLTPQDRIDIFRALEAGRPLPPAKPLFFPSTDDEDEEDQYRTYRLVKDQEDDAQGK